MRGSEVSKRPAEKFWTANGKVLADNKTVCTISVIHSQIKEPEKKVIDVLTEELGLERDQVKKRVEKNSSIERIKTNVDKQTGDKIREYDLAGGKWMKTIREIIHMEIWLPKCLDLPEVTIRGSWDWKSNMRAS